MHALTRPLLVAALGGCALSLVLHTLGFWWISPPLWPTLGLGAACVLVALAGLPLVYGIPARFRQNDYLRGLAGSYRWLHRLDVLTTGYALCFVVLDFAREEIATQPGDQRALWILVAAVLASSAKWLALVAHVRATEQLEA